MLDKDLVTPAPDITASEAKQLALKHFGIEGSLKKLDSERDLNYQLTDKDENRFLLKFGNTAEPQAITDLQTHTLLHVERVDPTLNVPRVMPSISGTATNPVVLHDGSTTAMRILSFVEGQPRDETEPTIKQVRSAGTFLARLDAALEGFRHPADDRELLWDFKSAVRLEPLLKYVEDPLLRKRLLGSIETFVTRVEPCWDEVPWQVIHNDFSPRNSVVDTCDQNRVIGAFDFGDVVYSPRVQDIAICSSYHVLDCSEPLQLVSELARAYSDESALSKEEASLLIDLIALRLTMSVIVASWRVTLFPENKDYILRYRDGAINRLNRILDVSNVERRAFEKDAC